MTTLYYRPRWSVLVLAGMLTMALVLSLSSPAIAKKKKSFYQQHNLVSDGFVPADHVDSSHLVNPWGMALSDTSPFWVSDNGTGFATLYNGKGQPFPVSSPLVVTIPPPAGSTPTGQVFNPTSTDFLVTGGSKSGPSFFIFATEDGTISGWNPSVPPPVPPAVFSTTAILAVPATGAVYKGLALGRTPAGAFLYATNFHAGTIDVFDKDFHTPNPPLAGSFSDPDIPAGFAPFNIQNLGNQLYVTYAKQDAAKHDDVPGKGNGFVDVFDTDGNFIERVASRGHLNSPWGLALAPAGFGGFSHDLLVGNFGDGRINAFDLSTDTFRGQLRNPKGKPITIDGLWALTFGKDGLNNGPTNVLFFTAGINDEKDGLFGSLTACQKNQCDEDP